VNYTYQLLLHLRVNLKFVVNLRNLDHDLVYITTFFIRIIYIFILIFFS